MLLKILLLCLLVETTVSKVSIKARTLSSTRLKRFAQSTNIDDFKNILSPILRSRVPGTNGHHEVKEYIINFFKDINWDVKLDVFDQDTVIGPKRFTNIIATANPNAKKFVLLTAHYDSKIIKSINGKEYIAATDSAVPCALMMSVAKMLDLKELMKNNDHTLQMVFFDGEEAFEEWSEDDSIYGSRHLAKLWSEPKADGQNHLQSIEALILLDLIGTKKTRFLSGFAQTHSLFEHLSKIESKLIDHRLINSNPSTRYFVGGLLNQPLGIEDDHVAFMKLGVPILHLISVPFPDCWHKLCDDEESLDQDTIQDLLSIFIIFFKQLLRA